MRAGRLLVLTTALAIAVVACNQADTPAETTGTTEDQGVVAARTQVLDDLGRNVIIPGYLGLAESSAGLRNDVEAACASPTPDIEILRQSWLVSLDNWLAIQSYRFGPLEDLDLGASIFYPIDPAKVDQNAAAGVTDLEGVGSDARGLEAIGRVLYATGELSEAACAYLGAMASRVADASRTVADAWSERGDEGLSGSFATTQAGIEMVVNDAINSVAEAAAYLGDPPPAVPPEHQDGRDMHEIEARIIAVREVYQGAGGHGLSTLVRLAFAPTDERMTERLQNAIQILSTSSSDPTSEDYLAAYEAVAAVHRTFTTEIASQLGTTLMFGDSDGDS